jgi:hypothetical protein
MCGSLVRFRYHYHLSNFFPWHVTNFKSQTILIIGYRLLVSKGFVSFGRKTFGRPTFGRHSVEIDLPSNHKIACWSNAGFVSSIVSVKCLSDKCLLTKMSVDQMVFDQMTWSCSTVRTMDWYSSSGFSHNFITLIGIL